jgi:hypothetical protein
MTPSTPGPELKPESEPAKNWSWRWPRILLSVLLTILLVGMALRIRDCDGRSRERFLHRVRSWGVQLVVQVPPGRKLVNVGWKNGDLWVLTRPAAQGESSDQAWEMDEYSSWGIFGGHVVLQENAVSK